MSRAPAVSAFRAEVAGIAHPSRSMPTKLHAPLARRRVLHVTPSPRGEVAQVVRAALEQARETGVDVHWATVASNGWFSAVGKRLTFCLEGSFSGGAELAATEQRTYTSVLRAGAEMLAELVPSPDLVFLHDPATAGLCGPLKSAGASVAWVCHVGITEPNQASRGAWDFLSPHLKAADALVFLRPGQIPAHRDGQWVIATSTSLGSLVAGAQGLEGQDVATVLAHLSSATWSTLQFHRTQ